MVKGAVDYAKMNEEAEIEEFLKSKKGLFNKFWNRYMHFSLMIVLPSPLYRVLTSFVMFSSNV